MSHRVLMVLSGIMRHAVLRGRLDRNPVQPVRVPLPKRARAIRPIPPASVEHVRRALLDSDDLESATLVSLMAISGLRPGEATALAWEHVGARTLLVEQASSGDGSAAKATKTGAMRTVRLLAPVVDDLAAWRSTAPEMADRCFRAATAPPGR
jgi:integrase